MRIALAQPVLILLCSGLVAAQPPLPPDPGALATRLNRQAYQAFHRKDFRGAEHHARRAWETDSTGSAGFSAANLGASLAMQGHLEEALRWQTRAGAIFAAAGDSVMHGRLLLAKAVTLHLKGDKGAHASLSEATGRIGAGDTGLASVSAEIYANSNDVEKTQSNYDTSRSMLVACRARRDSAGIVVFAMRMGCLDGSSGGHDDALKEYTEALGILRALGDTSRMGIALRNIGLANRKLRQYGPSEAAFREAVDLSRAAGSRKLEAEVLNDMSMLYAEMGDDARSVAVDQEAEAALRVLADDLRQGRQSDTVLLDFYQGIQVRYANLMPYDTDLFAGFCDQLALEPR